MKTNDQNPKILRLASGQLAGLMASVLEKGACFRFKASGYSMSPFIKNGDVVVISALADHPPPLGSVVAVRHRSGENVLVHRVVGRDASGLLIKGDNLLQPDGYFPLASLIGLVTAVERRGKRVGFGGRAVAWLSASGLLNRLILPFFRFLKKMAKVGS